MAFAILRVKKVKTLARVAQISRHVHRLRPVPNADPDRTPLNRKIVGSGDMLADVQRALPAKVRKNAVLAMDFMLTASPEFFRPNDPDAYGEFEASRLKEFRQHAEAFMRKLYGENLVSMVVHVDEATPHCHCLVMPKRPDGKLDARSLFNPQTLTTLQDQWGAWMSRIGLRRGMKNSKAKHNEVRQAYAVIRRLTPDRLRRLAAELDEEDQQGKTSRPVSTPRPSAPF